MKPIILFILLLTAANFSFAQIALKKPMQKKKDTVQKPPTNTTAATPKVVVKTTATVNAVSKVPPPSSVSAMQQAKANPVTAVKTPTAAIATQQNAATKLTPVNMPKAQAEVPINKNVPSAAQPILVKDHSTKIVPGHPYTATPVNNSTANLNDAFIAVTTGSAKVMGTGTNDNKDGDTHWSCGTFDQNEHPVTSFHDDSNSDEYVNGSKKILKMHIDNPATFSAFQNGRLHINIAPIGNDTWNIKEFALTLDFTNPKLTQVVTWKNVHLDQDARDIDLYFYYDGKNLVPRD